MNTNTQTQRSAGRQMDDIDRFCRRVSPIPLEPLTLEDIADVIALPREGDEC